MDEKIHKYLSSLKYCGDSKQTLFANKIVISANPQPVSFLEKITPKSTKDLTTTEEIYSEESLNFYNKIRNTGSLSPTPKKEKGSYTNSPDVYRLQHRDKYPEKSSFFDTRRDELPLINEKSRLKSKDRKINSERKDKINSIIRFCDNTVDASAASSAKLKYCIGKERIVIKKFAKEIKETTDRLLKINGHRSELMKKLYEEYKYSDNMYEDDKNEIATKYSTKNLRDYRSKAKGIKKFLNDFKCKIIP